MRHRFGNRSKKNDVVIEEGYSIEVSSWENDLDNCWDKTLHGLTREEAAFCAAICELFLSDNEVGNLYDPSEEELEYFCKQMAKVVKESGIKKFKDIDLTDEESEVFYDVIEPLGLTGGDFFSRCVDKYRVFRVPSKIVLEDITEEF